MVFVLKRQELHHLFSVSFCCTVYLAIAKQMIPSPQASVLQKLYELGQDLALVEVYEGVPVLLYILSECLRSFPLSTGPIFFEDTWYGQSILSFSRAFGATKVSLP